MDDWETVTCMAFRYTGPGGRVVVPEEIAVIGRGAFLGSKGVTEIVIHRDVTVVQEGAFAGCTELERFVVDPDNKYYEAHGAFLLVKNTGTLLSAPAVRGDVELPPEITELKGEAFRGARNLVSICLPETLKDIPLRCFQDCVSLKTIRIPERVADIRKEAFRGCGKLREVSLPPGKQVRLWDGAFRDCASLKRFSLPPGTSVIPDFFFAGCASLRELKLPDSMLALGPSALFGCKSLVRLHIPDRVSRIGENCFEGCATLKEVTGMAGVRVYGTRAFAGCDSLRSVTLLATTREVHRECFASCPALQELVLEGESVYLDPKAMKATSPGDADASVVPLIAPNLRPDLLPKELRLSALYGISRMEKKGMRPKPEYMDGWRQILKGLQGQIWTSLEMLYLLMDQRMISPRQLNAYLREAAKQNRPDLTAALLEYRNRSLSTQDMLRLDYDRMVDALGMTEEARRNRDWKVEDLEDGSVRITGYMGKATDVAVPDSVRGVPVSALGDLAFSPDNASLVQSARKRLRTLTRVAIPEGVERLGREVFLGCASLKTVALPASLTEAAEETFRGCPPDLTLQGPAGSFAERYARAHGLRFQANGQDEDSGG